MLPFRGSTQGKSASKIFRFCYKKAANDKKVPDRVGSGVSVLQKQKAALLEQQIAGSGGNVAVDEIRSGEERAPGGEAAGCGGIIRCLLKRPERHYSLPPQSAVESSA